MRKIISFSLWGTNTRYTDGAIKNTDLAKKIYPDWTCRFYLGKSVSREVTDLLARKDNTEVVVMDEEGDWSGMFWRFYPASEPDVDAMISRDTDSRLTMREKSAVDEWLLSDKKFHIMRDHPYHAVPILGGMWGAKKGAIPQMRKLINEYTKDDVWQVDQNFLAHEVYPLIKEDVYEHDEFFADSPFPYPRDEKHFVGQAYDGNDKILDADEYFYDYVLEETSL